MASERTSLDDNRRWVATRARGATLEIGVGAWPTLRHYGKGVTVTGIDVSADAVAKARRTVAQQSVAQSGRSATVEQADAMALPFADGTFDSVVFSFSLCGVPDVRGALLEALRVLKPGGELLMADHVESLSRPVRLLQRVVEAVSVRMGGEHFTRRPSVQARELDLEVMSVERPGGRMLERLHARKPA